MDIPRKLIYNKEVMVAQGATYQHKRHGKHQKRTKPFMKVYWPYVPLATILITGFLFSALWHPRMQGNTLPYATSMSSSALLSSTNQQRANNGKKALVINGKLNQAAQAKANDMAQRNYWSHNTPEGDAPWVFIDQAGYSYKTAGENLAYGFATSADTVVGWMNSPPHKANLLSSNYVDVGFGYANSADFQDSGPETIVVAMYGAPLASPSVASSSTGSSASQPSTVVTTPKPKSVAKAEPKVPEPTTSQPVAVALSEEQNKNQPVQESATQSVSRLAILTSSNLPWLASSLTAIIMLGAVLLALRHSIALHKWLRRGERYILHHTLFDITVISLIGLCFIVGQSAGLIK